MRTTVGRTLGNGGLLPAADPSTTGRYHFNKKPFLRLKTTSINIEGLSRNKEILLADMCSQLKIDVLLIQETHRGTNNNRPKVDGMRLVVERPHEQYGSAVFVRPDINIKSTHMTCMNDIEILTIELESCSITSVYKPPNEEFSFEKPDNFGLQNIKIVMGDFNCQSSNWGYNTTDRNGEELECWAEREGLKLIHDPKLRSSFRSGRWRRGYNPDNIFISEQVAQHVVKVVEEPIPRTQHSPITCAVVGVIRPEEVPFKRRFNFKKANWDTFTNELDREVVKLQAEPGRYDDFVELVKKISRKYIPRGCRTQFVSGINSDSKILLKKYQEKYENDPFSEDTIHAGEELMESIADGRRERWTNLLADLDMAQNSRRAWKLIKNLTNDPKVPAMAITQITPNQIANQLLSNGKTTRRTGTIKLERYAEENDFLGQPFTSSELEHAIKLMKTNKAAGPDDIRTEQVKNFGPMTIEWLVKLINKCTETMKFPKLWRKAQVVALLKPGKEPTDPKNFRPVSLLCHLYKAFERMILERIASSIDENLIPEQAGFRPGKSCCSQVLNLTQHIEDGYEKKLITGAAFIDLSAAYDTVNHKMLINKLYNITKDFRLTNVIKEMLTNRRFFVTLQGRKSRWRNQKNGLPQGSVLSPLLYNIYTNDQPDHKETKRFIYADDTAITAQGICFEEVEAKLTNALDMLATYYDQNHLKPNPGKTHVCAFHLRNKEARRKLNILWRGVALDHCDTPRYLGIKLDRTLSFKKHCEDLKGKISSRNGILRKLTGTTWGANPQVLRSSALGLCFAAGEYGAPVWEASAHTRHVDIALNESVRIITGCLRPTPVLKIYPLAGIAPPTIRRTVAAEIEKTKQEKDPRHPLYNHSETSSRLKSRKSFLRRTMSLKTKPELQRLSLWKEIAPAQEGFTPKEQLSSGNQLPYPTWRTLNRLKTGVSKCRSNMVKWGYAVDDRCDCGEIQTPEHLLVCCRMNNSCTQEDLMLATNKGINVAEYWKGRI